MQKMLVIKSLTTRLRRMKLLVRVARPLLEKILTERMRRLPRHATRRVTRWSSPMMMAKMLEYGTHLTPYSPPSVRFISFSVENDSFIITLGNISAPINQ